MSAAPGPEAEPESPLDRLRREPQLFTFDAAVRLLALAQRTPDLAGAARFRAGRGHAFPAAEVLDATLPRQGASAELVVGLIGLTGPAGVLPKPFTAEVVRQFRQHAPAMPEFLDLLAQPLIAQYARAGARYRPHRLAEAAAAADPPGDGPLGAVLLALTGHGTPHLAGRLAAGPEPLMHYAGLFSALPRSADRLACLVSDWIGRPVEVVQFVGAWLPLPPAERTRLGAGRGAGQFTQLGRDAAIGARAWDPQGRLVLRLGPLPLREFEALLPGGEALRRLVSLVRTFLGLQIGFALNPVLALAEVPPLRLPEKGGVPQRLGWNTWLRARRRAADAADAIFDSEVAGPLDGRAG